MEFAVERDHGGVAFAGGDYDAGEAVAAGVGDLPLLHELAQAAALEAREDAGGGDVESSFLVERVLVEGAAAGFYAVDQEPVGLALFPILGGEDVGFAEDFSVEGLEGAEVRGEDGSSELRVHWGAGAMLISLSLRPGRLSRSRK